MPHQMTIYSNQHIQVLISVATGNILKMTGFGIINNLLNKNPTFPLDIVLVKYDFGEEGVVK